MRESTYTVTWAREDGEQHVCSGLDVRTALGRLKAAIRNSGPITVLSVERDSRISPSSRAPK